MSKSITIGSFVTASPKACNTWVTCENSNEEEQNYYKDVFSKDGCLIYCEGEICKIESFDEENQTVTLSNDNIDDNDFSPVFTIPFAQFEADFLN